MPVKSTILYFPKFHFPLNQYTLEEQETILEIEKKRLIERKRKQLVKDVKEAEQEFKANALKPESVEDIMKGIDETDKDNKIYLEKFNFLKNEI